LGLYRTVMRYAGHQTIAIVALATAVASAIMTVFILPHNVPGPITPRSITAIYWLLNTALCAGMRMTMRKYFRGMRIGLPASRFTHAPEKPGRRPRVAIYGAGAAGNQLLMALRLGSNRHPVVFIDDNP